MTSRRLLPAPDETSAPFWASTANHVLSIARCSRCEEFNHPPDMVCRHCLHPDPQFRFEPVGDRGVVRSWLVMRQSFLPGFDDDLPFLLVDVALDGTDDLRLIGRLVDGPDTELSLGTPVRVTFEDLADGVAVPAFAVERDS